MFYPMIVVVAQGGFRLICEARNGKNKMGEV